MVRNCLIKYAKHQQLKLRHLFSTEIKYIQMKSFKRHARMALESAAEWHKLQQL